MVLPFELWATVDFRSLPQQLVNGIFIGSLYALLALGYTMVYGVLRLINFAHGEVYMLGAWTALFTSYALGFGPNAAAASAPWYGLPIMLLASMTMCALIGVIIERVAYRPMRNQPRIASLITAIGVSLLLQYGGQLFLPTSPPPNIRADVNPFQGNMNFNLTTPSEEMIRKAEGLKPAMEEAERAWKTIESSSTGELTDEAKKVRETFFNARNAYDAANSEAQNSAISLSISKGYLIMFGMTMFLMAILRYLVMNTKPGRAMRAVSHDFDSAALMGVNVNKVIVYTFLLGSALAGAGAMMKATFVSGTKIDTFFGMLDGVKAFVAAVLGGIGNIPGAVLGGILMGVAEALVVWMGGSEYKDAVAFLILIAVLIFKPGGLMGSAKVEKV